MPKVLADNGGVTEKVFFDFDREYTQLKAQASAVAGKMRQLKKRGADDGLDVEEYEYQRKRKERPLEERRKAYENGRLYLKFWRDPLGSQMTEIQEINDEVGLTDEQRLKKWEDEGYVAGAGGKNRSTCPHPDPNSVGARAWSEGYDKGQATLAPKKGGGQPKPVEDGPTSASGPAASTDTTTGKLTGGVTAAAGPKDEPEVVAAKARGKSRTKGVTYWHNAELKKVYEVTTADPDPVGAVSITKPEFEKLKAEYEKADEDDWNAPVVKQEPPVEAGDENDDDGEENLPTE